MSRRGFTLVEVLISLLFVGMLAIVITSVMNMAVTLFQTLDETTKERNQGSKIISIIRRDLQGIVDLPDNQIPVETREDENENLVLNFVTSGRMSANEEGSVAPFNECGYASKLSRINSNLLVLYRRHDWYVDKEPLRGGVWELVSDRVMSYEFEFSNEETEYTRAWPDGQLPGHAHLILKLVKPEVDLEVLGLDPESWPVDTYEEVVEIK